ncbi:hypothetical protein PFICI_01924 [Pestalotiopsis fici W106-1]|uniref:Uncharacterized protein n=1 Tax=Pestalotiopsis fici (strain W106-1 / CGMCC3.15140) TaxID=1229662 RepID=W3XS89_PESFW|nr:uncharacterized protein PFICI_01924 [Pestalotiopsis fici W106-1]ETS88096.1 hypothetical protein PFICI_01924 [Pestalotiopsis fici W106-1]
MEIMPADGEVPLLVRFFSAQYPPMQDRLLLECDARSLLMLAKTSKALQREILSLWDINRSLSRFFDDPVAFRNAMGQFDAIIAGSFAVQFFEHVSWPYTNLDILVRDESGLESMHEYLVGSANYEFWNGFTPIGVALELGHSSEGLRDVLDCRWYTRHSRRDWIQLIATKGTPSRFLFRNNQLSCNINCITSTKAYSLFPHATFVDHKMIATKAFFFDQDTTDIVKWEERGWVLEDDVLEDRRGEFNTTLVDGCRSTRRIGDKYTWTMSLDPEGLTMPQTCDQAFEANTFAISKPEIFGIGPLKNCFIRAIGVDQDHLRHTFTCSHPLEYDFFRHLKKGVWDTIRQLDPHIHQLMSAQERDLQEPAEGAFKDDGDLVYQFICHRVNQAQSEEHDGEYRFGANVGGRYDVMESDHEGGLYDDFFGDRSGDDDFENGNGFGDDGDDDSDVDMEIVLRIDLESILRDKHDLEKDEPISKRLRSSVSNNP